MIFAREVSDSLTSLVKAIDAATVKNSSCKMGSFVVFCTGEDDDLKDQLKKLAEKEGLKKCILTIDNPAGPSKYEIAKEADITVVYYNEREIKVNRAFKKGELDDKGVKQIVADITAKLPKKKDEKKSDK